MQICLKDTAGNDVTVTSGSASGSVSFRFGDLTFTITADEARRLVHGLGGWLTPAGAAKRI